MRGDEQVLDFLNEQLRLPTGCAAASRTCAASPMSPARTSFEAILADEETHIDYLETQLGLIEQLSEPLYLAQLVEQPSD
jgi:bacterioferritin (cytochrome b1)